MTGALGPQKGIYPIITKSLEEGLAPLSSTPIPIAFQSACSNKKFHKHIKGKEDAKSKTLRKPEGH